MSKQRKSVSFYGLLYRARALEFDSDKDMTIRYEDFSDWNWKLPDTRVPDRIKKDYSFLDIDWDDPENHAYMMKVGEFHQGRIGNPTTKEHLEKWVKDIEHLPEFQIRAIIEEYELGKANE